MDGNSAKCFRVSLLSSTSVPKTFTQSLLLELLCVFGPSPKVRGG
jgi:hypothetical protein